MWISTNRSNNDHTFCFRQILGKKWEYNEVVHQLFTEFKKAYDSVRRKVLYNNLFEFGSPMNPVRLIHMCLNETYSRVRVGKNLADMFPIRNGLKQGDALKPSVFNFALEYATGKVQVIQGGLKLNGKYQILVYAVDVNMLGGSVHAIKENVEALGVASKENGLEINADKTRYMVMSRDQNAGRSENIKTDNSFFEGVEEFKYLGTTLTDKNFIQDEINSRLNSGNICYHSVYKRLSSSLLSIKFKD